MESELERLQESFSMFRTPDGYITTEAMIYDVPNILAP
jgi:hypothetical protein